jgi:adenosylmethionine-8-amino-7-oxononanoate aminotransferase
MFAHGYTFGGHPVSTAVALANLDIFENEHVLEHVRANEDECERLLRGYLSKALFDAGIYCRADDRGDPVIQLAPPLTMGQADFDDIESRLRGVLKDAEKHL